MLTENTATKLREMHLGVMASAFKEQLTDSQFQNMSFEDRFGLTVDKEWVCQKKQSPEKAHQTGRILRAKRLCGRY